MNKGYAAFHSLLPERSGPAVRVMLVEDDPFAREMMASLLRNDARVDLVGLAGGLPGLARRLAEQQPQILLAGGNPGWLAELADLPVQPGRWLLPLVGAASPALLRRLAGPAFCGCLVKNETAYALPQAVAMAAAGAWVMTPAASRAAARAGLHPTGAVLLSGRLPVAWLAAS